MTYDFEPVHELEAMKGVGSMDAAQKFLKAHGFILLAFGPYRVTFYHKDTRLDARDRIPPEAINTMTGREYREFARELKSK